MKHSKQEITPYALSEIKVQDFYLFFDFFGDEKINKFISVQFNSISEINGTLIFGYLFIYFSSPKKSKNK